MWEAARHRPGYGLTKNAGTALIQVIAEELSPEQMQIVSFNPGPVFTQAARNDGYTKDMFDPWNDGEFPAFHDVYSIGTCYRGTSY